MLTACARLHTPGHRRRAGGLLVEPALMDRLLADTAEGADALPLRRYTGPAFPRLSATAAT